MDVHGKSGHGAQPHLCINPISVASHIISAVEGCTATGVDPFDPAVVSFCSIHGGDCNNAIPASVKMTGTIRTYADEVTRQLANHIQSIAENMANAYQAKSCFRIVSAASATINDNRLAAWACDVLGKEFGKGRIIEDIKPAMTGEDFGSYGRKAPLLYLWVGAEGEEKTCNLHNSRFDIDEKVLPAGIQAYASLALGNALW